MALASSVQYDFFGIALTTARKIEIEARKVEPNLLRLVLLSNMYDKCASKVAEMSNHEDDSLLFPAEEDLTTANQSPSEPYDSANDDPSSSEDSDEWESDDSSSETEEAPPAYSLYTSPQVTVSVYEYRPSDDSDHSDSPCDKVVANFDAFNLHDAKNSTYYFTSSIRDSSESLIPPRTQPENLTSLGAPQVTKGALGTLTVGRCWPVNSKEGSRISRLLHSLRAIVS